MQIRAWLKSIPRMVACVGILLVLALVASLIVDQWRNPLAPWAKSPPKYSQESASGALELLKDWATWMAGIQTAALGGIALLAKERLLSEKLSRMAALAVVLLGGALFASASILAALPSLALRVSDCSKETHAPCFDVYSHPLMAGVPVRFGLLLIWQHWLWALGLISFAAFAIGALLSPPSGQGKQE